jgi:hypothetical protein
MPRSWLDVGHQVLGLGEFPTAPMAEYLARSVSALCTFYGGLLLLLARDVRRFIRTVAPPADLDQNAAAGTATMDHGVGKCCPGPRLTLCSMHCKDSLIGPVWESFCFLLDSEPASNGL